jgi:hypothetical protein
MQDCVFEPGATLVTQGEPADDIIIIQSGQVYVIADPDWKEEATPSTDPAQCIQVHPSCGQAMLMMRIKLIVWSSYAVYAMYRLQPV